MARIEDTIRGVIPARELETLIDILGMPYSGLNLSLSEGALISPADGQVLLALKEDHAPTAGYVRKLRKVLNETYPDTTFFFLAPDISTQVLNFGLAAPIDVQVAGRPRRRRAHLRHRAGDRGRRARHPRRRRRAPRPGGVAAGAARSTWTAPWPGSSG